MRTSADRRVAIQRQLHLNGTVSVEFLAKQLGVSVVTVRRDLNAMDEERIIRRTHGGAMAQSVKAADQAFALRAETDASAKRAIASAAMEKLLPNQTILMNDGSTIFALALEMVAIDRPLTVVTAGVNIATCLAEKTSITAYLLGGRVRHLSLSTSGGFAEEMLRQFNADIAIISVDAISVKEGVTFSQESDAALARLMSLKAARTIVLATARKLHNVDRITACPISRIGTLITDCTDREKMDPFSAENLEVISAPINVKN